MSSQPFVRGGSFLTQETTPERLFTPEDLSSEQRLYAKTAREFMENEVIPVSDRIEQKDFAVTRALFRKAGELGLLMADVPPEYGGLGLDKSSSALLAESLNGQGSFAVMWGAHTGIGTLPLVYYGTAELKRKYLPGLADGSLVGCYCLTEPTAGSDALSGRTKATLSSDGEHYLLNGTKQFVTNGGLADVFTIFAKIDGEHFTGFLLDRNTPGLSLGPEEHKMGIRGASTTTVMLDDARVPSGNILGEIGQGHKIAFNILNIGRFKLGAACVGACKRAIQEALTYALERTQFGKRLADFGLIREKLAEMTVRTYAAEAASYRTVGLIDDLVRAGGTGGDTALQALEEYSVECAMMKILGSEALDYVVDESVQILGGYGYCSDYPAERRYRDSRINRIFEGTNEINRLLIPGMLLRKAMKGEIPLFSAAKALQDELMELPPLEWEEDPSLLAPERKLVANLRKSFLFVAGVAAQKHGRGLAEQQVILARLADLALNSYGAESAVLRALKDAAARGQADAAVPLAIARVACETALSRSEVLAREALAALEQGDTLATLLAGFRRLFRRVPPDTLAFRDRIAERLVVTERLVY